MNAAKYVFDETTFSNNVKELRNAFRSASGDRLVLGFSVKTCPHPFVLRASANSNLLAEVTSPDELALARECGFSFSDIIYNGVIPDPAGKLAVARHQGIVNLESYTEFKQVEALAFEKNICVDVGIRINVNHYNDRVSRFGVDPSSEEMTDILRLCNDSAHIRITGVHAHTFRDYNLMYYHDMVGAALDVAKWLGATYVDLGSRIYSKMDRRLEVQVKAKLPYGAELPTFSDYAKIVEEYMKYNDLLGKVCLILEPGTPVIADAVRLEAEVVNIRNVRGKNIATLNCSKYDLGFLAQSYVPPVDIIHNDTGSYYEGLTIYGNTCTEDDVIFKGYRGKLAIGGEFIFQNVGAYSVSLANNLCCKPLKMERIPKVMADISRSDA